MPNIADDEEASPTTGDPAVEVVDALEPYRYRKEHVTRGAERLDEAFATSDQYSGWSGVLDKLRGPDFKLEDVAKDTPLDVALGRVAAYRLHLHQLGEQPGCRFGPQHDSGEFAYPTRIAEVADDEVKLWKALASRVLDPGAVARVHDLLGERGVNRRSHAQTAGRAYLSIDNPSVRDETGGLSLSGVAYLVRAWELSRRYSLWTLHADVQLRLYQVAVAELAAARYAPGVLLPILEALGADAIRSQPAEACPIDVADVKALVRRAIERYPEGRLLSQTMNLARHLATDDDERTALVQEQAERLLAYALEVDGFLRMVRLQDAIAFARDRVIRGVAAEATRELQRISADSLGMETIQSSIAVPADFFERQVTPFTESPDWANGLAYFLSMPCPTGSYQRLLDQEREHANTFLFRRLFGTQHITREGLPSWETQSEEDKAASERAWLAGVQAKQHGQVLAIGLQEFAKHYGVPDEAALVSAFSRRGEANQPLCLSLARALRLYLQEEYEASSNLIVGKVEAAARMLLLELDEAVFRIQIGRDPGGYGGLFGLVDGLQSAGLDEDWAYFLRWLLLGPPGENVRNDLTHGLRLGLDPISGALLLRAAALLITLTQDDNEAAPRTKEELRTVLAASTQKPWPTAAEGLDRILVAAISIVGTAVGIGLGISRLARRLR